MDTLSPGSAYTQLHTYLDPKKYAWCLRTETLQQLYIEGYSIGYI